jgi:hypothetical protein
MGRKHFCKICNDANAAPAINAMIESHVRQAMIHEQFPAYSTSQISRHSRGCLQPKPMADLADAPASRDHEKWLQRADLTYARASADGDTKSAAQAISVAVRALTAMHKKQEQEATKAEKAAANPDDIKFTVAQIDALIKHDAESGVGDRGYPKVYTLFNEEQQFRQLVDAIWSNRALLPVALAAATPNFLPQRESQNVTAHD